VAKCRKRLWRIVDMYKRRWLMRSSSTRPQDASFKARRQPDRYRRPALKLVAIAAKAGNHYHPAFDRRATATVISPSGLPSMPTRSQPLAASSNPRGPKQTALDPHPPDNLAWAAWIIGRLGGWDGYPFSKNRQAHHHETRPRILLRCAVDGASKMCACPRCGVSTGCPRQGKSL